MTPFPSLMHTIERPSPVMVRGAGSYLYDADGKAYLDFVQGWAVNALGHCPAEVTQALSAQAATLLTASPAYHNLPAAQCAAKLAEATDLARAFLCNSGAEANECAVKLARKWGRLHRSGAFRVITTQNGFHGRTLAMMAASGKPGWDAMFPPNIEGFTKVPFNDLAAVQRAISDQTCAVMVEPIQGEAGVLVPDAGYLASLRELTQRAGVLLIFDEVQTGIGRTGTLFRFQFESARPDILTLGKGLGGGVPLAAVVATESAACFTAGEHGGTYAGNPLMARCGLAVLNVVSEPAFLVRVRVAARRLEQGLAALVRDRQRPSRWRGAGLLQALMLDQPVANAVAQRALELGLLLNAPRPDVLRFMPSLRVTDDEIDQMLELLSSAFDDL